MSVSALPVVSNLLILPAGSEHSELPAFFKIMVGEKPGIPVSRNPMANTKMSTSENTSKWEVVLITSLPTLKNSVNLSRFCSDRSSNHYQVF